MIQANNPAGSYRTLFTSPASSAQADLPLAKGGGGQGFGPHELIEAGLATCMVMTARMYAVEHHWPLEDARCQVRLEKNAAGDITFWYSLELPGLSPEQQQKILALMSHCPVARTLSKPAMLQLEHTSS
jgi:putative redox protein